MEELIFAFEDVLSFDYIIVCLVARKPGASRVEQDDLPSDELEDFHFIYLFREYSLSSAYSLGLETVSSLHLSFGILSLRVEYLNFPLQVNDQSIFRSTGKSLRTINPLNIPRIQTNPLHALPATKKIVLTSLRDSQLSKVVNTANYI